MLIKTTSTRHRGITLVWMLGFFSLLMLFTWFLQIGGTTEKVDQLLHDSWVRMTPRQPQKDVAIVAIDPQSLREIGRWPWSRETQTLLLEQLAKYQIKAAVIDILFLERSTDSEVDVRLVDAIDAFPISVLPILTEGLPGQDSRDKLPLPEISRVVSDLGQIHLPIDKDGIVRRMFLKVGFREAHWSALSLAAYEQVTANESLGVTAGKKTSEKRFIPGKRARLDSKVSGLKRDFEVLIPFYGPSGTFPNIPAADVISGKVPRESLEGKVVFVGLTSTGLYDVVPTPVSSLNQLMPGVEVHANVYSALLDGSVVEPIDTSLNMVVAFILLPLMLLVYSRAKPQWGLLIAIGCSLLPILLSFILYRWFRGWYPPLTASVPILCSYVVWSLNRLNYINRFLEQETAMMAPFSPTDASGNDLLADFFRNAERHLPLDGWMFMAKGQHFSGGQSLNNTIAATTPVNRWIQQNDYYSKRYPTPGQLEIHVQLRDEALAKELTEYIDTLARVQSRKRPAPFTGAVERLQLNTLKLSDQVAWLRNVSAFSDSILEGSPAGYLAWNAVGELVRSNELAFELLPAIGRNPLLIEFIGLVSNKAGEQNRQRMQELILESATWQITHVHDERELVINFNTIGRTLTERLICATVIDLSDIRGAERARAEMVDYLSHDLRSPLISALYSLESDDASSLPAENIKRIEANINRSLRMMDDLLHVARADSLSAETFGEVLFNAVVDNALDQLLPQAKSRNIAFEIDTEDEDLWMDGDAASLERAVVNIVGNAIKYSSDGGKVFIKTQQIGDHLALVVRDQGVGIDPAMMGELFTRFKRDARVAKKFKGIGLGLALVARVVSQHGGEVKAHSPGSGTSITMTLPLKADQTLIPDE